MPVLTETDFTWLSICCSKKHREDVGLQHLVPDHAVENVEMRSLRHLWKAEAKNTIEGHQAEGFVRLLGGHNKVCMGADGTYTDVVLDKNAADFTCTKGDGDYVTVTTLANRLIGLVCEGNIYSCLGLECIEALMGGASLI